MSSSRTLTYLIILFLPIYLGCESQTETSQNPSNGQENARTQSPLGTPTSIKVLEETAQQLLLEIHDPDGIGQGKISMPSQVPPEKVVIQVHLRGLESFRITSGQSTFSLQLQSHGDFDVLAEYDGRKLPAEDIPRLITVMPGERKPTTIPLADGEYFQITLPFYISMGPELTLEWIDFYR